MAELMSELGHERFHLHGEDRGAEFAYAVAATYRDRVKTLSFCEMPLSGEGLEEWSDFTPDNATEVTGPSAEATRYPVPHRG